VSRFDALLRRLESVVSLAAVAALFAIMLIVVADVFMRYVLNSPFAWAYDLVGLYLLATVFFLSLSSTFAAHAHVSVDLLMHRLGPRGRDLGRAGGADRDGADRLGRVSAHDGKPRRR
jgi:TRAP-type C4-dicarboxylate transport system permease small subunit